MVLNLVRQVWSGRSGHSEFSAPAGAMTREPVVSLEFAVPKFPTFLDTPSHEARLIHDASSARWPVQQTRQVVSANIGEGVFPRLVKHVGL